MTCWRRWCWAEWGPVSLTWYLWGTIKPGLNFCWIRIRFEIPSQHWVTSPHEQGPSPCFGWFRQFHYGAVHDVREWIESHPLATAWFLPFLGLNWMDSAHGTFGFFSLQELQCSRRRVATDSYGRTPWADFNSEMQTSTARRASLMKQLMLPQLMQASTFFSWSFASFSQSWRKMGKTGQTWFNT